MRRATGASIWRGIPTTMAAAWSARFAGAANGDRRPVEHFGAHRARRTSASSHPSGTVTLLLERPYRSRKKACRLRWKTITRARVIERARPVAERPRSTSLRRCLSRLGPPSRTLRPRVPALRRRARPVSRLVSPLRLCRRILEAGEPTMRPRDRLERRRCSAKGRRPPVERPRVEAHEARCRDERRWTPIERQRGSALRWPSLTEGRLARSLDSPRPTVERARRTLDRTRRSEDRSPRTLRRRRRAQRPPRPLHGRRRVSLGRPSPVVRLLRQACRFLWQAYRSPRQARRSPRQACRSPRQTYRSPRQTYRSPGQAYRSPRQSCRRPRLRGGEMLTAIDVGRLALRVATWSARRH
jgi:hypothetical protein